MVSDGRNDAGQPAEGCRLGAGRCICRNEQNRELRSAYEALYKERSSLELRIIAQSFFSMVIVQLLLVLSTEIGLLGTLLSFTFPPTQTPHYDSRY